MVARPPGAWRQRRGPKARQLSHRLAAHKQAPRAPLLVHPATGAGSGLVWKLAAASARAGQSAVSRLSRPVVLAATLFKKARLSPWLCARRAQAGYGHLFIRHATSQGIGGLRARKPQPKPNPKRPAPARGGPLAHTKRRTLRRPQSVVPQHCGLRPSPHFRAWREAAVVQILRDNPRRNTSPWLSMTRWTSATFAQLWAGS